MLAAQTLAGLGMAAFLLAGWVPGLHRHAGTIRAGVLAVFLIGGAVLVIVAFDQ